MCSGREGQRTIALEELHREPGTTPDIETTLEPGELILRIRVPKTPMGRASTYHKIRDRESYAFALASAAVALDMDGDTVVLHASPSAASRRGPGAPAPPSRRSSARCSHRRPPAKLAMLRCRAQNRATTTASASSSGHAPSPTP